jgi:hypothetical protein
MYLKATLRAEARKLRRWIEVTLLVAFQFSDDIIAFLKLHLVDLQPYMPDNVYKAMGGFVVAASLVFGFLAAHRTVKQAAKAEKGEGDAGQPAA